MRRRPAGPGLLLVVALCVVLPPAAARAQVDTLGQVVEQDTVRVRALRVELPLRELATSATVVTRRDIRQAGARALAGAIADVPGIHVYDLSGSETQSQVETRGFTSLGFTSHVRVLVDEIPVNDVEGARVDWNLLAPPQVERIELLRGPASYLYGDAAMAGVIHIVTREAAQGVRGWGGVSAGSDEEQIGHGGLSWRRGAASAAGSLAYRSLDGWRDHSAATLVGGQGAAEAAFGRWTGRLQGLLARTDEDVPGPLPDPLWRTEPRRAVIPVFDIPSPDFRRSHTAEGALILRGPAGPVGVTALVSTDARDLDARETIVPAGTLDRVSNAHRQRGELRLRGGQVTRAEWVVGADAARGLLDTAYFPWVDGDRDALASARVRQDAFGAYALARRRLRERLVGTAALRGDWLRSDVDGGDDHRVSAASPALALNYTTVGGGNAFVSAGGAFKAPTLEQLYDPRPYFIPDSLGRLLPVTISSTSLKPQRGWNVDFGMRAKPAPAARGEATFYYGRSRDEIGFDLASFRYNNIARSIHYGFEGGIGTPLGHGLAADVSYAYTRAVFDGGPTDGKQINGVPVHVAALRLSLAHALHGEVALDTRYVDGQWIDEANTRGLPAYGVTDLTVLQRVGPAGLSFAVRNVFDHRYATAGYVTSDFTGSPVSLAFPAAGRALRFGVQWSPREP